MDTQLKNRKIILGVTGGIAAYKSCTLCRLLIKAGADVYVCMTPAATKLVGKDTFEALTGHKVAIDIFDEAKDISHVGLAKMQVLTQWVWGGSRKTSFLISSYVVPMLPV